MHHKRQARDRDVIRDIRSGKNMSAVLKKYGLSSLELRKVFRRLLSSGAMSSVQFDNEIALYLGTGSVRGVRRIQRKRITYPLPLYDGGDPFKPGRVVDLSESGVCVEGIESRVGEVKTFIVRSGHHGSRFSFVFEGICRWVRDERQSGKALVAGFQITSISAPELRVLQKVLQDEQPT